MTSKASAFKPAKPLRLTCAAALFLMAACAGAPPPVSSPSTSPRQPQATREVKPKVALVLGGGGARGFAHLGVLRALEQEKIPIDIVVGTSVGSLIGALYADTGNVLDLEYTALTIRKEDLFDYQAMAVFSGGFIKGEALEQFLRARLRHSSIEAFKVPFAAVAVDVRTGETVVFDHGPAAPAIHASCAIPGAFVPVQYQGRTFVDGGVTNPLPADVARKMGAEVVIAVAIPAAVPSQAPTNPVSVAYQSTMIMSAEIGKLRARESDIVITPAVGDVAYDDFSQNKRLIDAGVAAAQKAMPAIYSAIAAKTRWVPAEEQSP